MVVHKKGMVMSMREFLKEVLPFWDKLKENHKNLILDTILIKNHKKNDKLYHIGNVDMGLRIVYTGKLRVFITSEDGNEMNLYRLEKKQVCALSVASMMHVYNIDVSMQAEEDMVGYVIPEKIYNLLYDEYPQVKDFVHKIMVSRLGEVIGIVNDLVFHSVTKRLADKILYHRRLQDSMEIFITHEELASDIGSAREVVSRTLKQLQQHKLIEVNRGRIYILNEEELGKF